MSRSGPNKVKRDCTALLLYVFRVQQQLLINGHWNVRILTVNVNVNGHVNVNVNV